MPLLALTTRKGLLLVRDDGDRFALESESFLGARMSITAQDPRDGTLYACLDHGHWGVKFHRSADLGKTWTELEAPKYPEGSEIRPGDPAVLKYLWAVGFPSDKRPGTFYLGSEPGGLFELAEQGAASQLNDALWNHPSRPEFWFGGGRDEAGIHSICIDPNDDDRMLVGVSCCGVFETRDGGKSWTHRNKGLKAEFMPNPDVEFGHDPHLLVQCRTQPHKLWQQNHCGVFHSDDYGENWQDVSQPDVGVKFGFTVVVDPDDGDTAWVVPATSDEKRVAIDRALFVAHTTDGGKTWRKYREGLPQEHVYDFAYRHGMSLCGDHLALATAGGSFYTSSDRGETWRTFSSQLPPIYAVTHIDESLVA
ncbi:hypothetical protein LOC68_27680 [Blastopirellula sp. JC732]|uniref:Glycosyl hydrolase n=1 Tax=Blastopirellula sediminis TaxID=2894196 RepID=A0A9X1MRG4_9BACT|nr:sialidase family protein [Blastopirellula sediminis]MCC9604508.1 hypothetical protein [Blastopirellula sediminis]MCC9632193.1 hypothetical protein [Blastopirellula sediminis]